MSGTYNLTGKCMCNAVKFTATANAPDVAVCHCEMCRRWCGGPFMEVTCKEVVFEGDENIRKVRSSDWAERGFCEQCGSNLFYHIVGTDEYQIAAGLFDDQSAFRMSLQVYTDSKPDFYQFSNSTKMMTAKEVIAAFAPPSD